MSDIERRIAGILGVPQLAAFATVTPEGKPWVRYVFCEGREDMTIRFATQAGSRKVAQIGSNPEVHLTLGASAPAAGKPYLQIQGRAGFFTDEAARRGFWKDSLKGYFQGADDPEYGVVVVEAYRIELCSPGLLPEIWNKGAMP